jgi:hypothetical protein
MRIRKIGGGFGNDVTLKFSPRLWRQLRDDYQPLQQPNTKKDVTPQASRVKEKKIKDPRKASRKGRPIRTKPVS